MRKLKCLVVMIFLMMCASAFAEELPEPTKGFEWANIALGLDDSALVDTDGIVYNEYYTYYMFDGNRLPSDTVKNIPRFLLTRKSDTEKYSYFTIDLGELYTIGGINYCYPGIHDGGTYRVYGSVNNKDFTQLTRFSYGSGAGETGMLTFTPEKYRYIKIERDAVIAVHLISCYELEVFGLVDSFVNPAPSYALKNVAAGLGKSSVTTDGEALSSMDESLMFDKDTTKTRTVIGKKDTAYGSFTVDLGRIYSVSAIRYFWAGIHDGGEYTVYGSLNNEDWIYLTEFKYDLQSGPGDTGITGFSPSDIRYVKVSRGLTSGFHAISCYEFEIYADVRDSATLMPEGCNWINAAAGLGNLAVTGTPYSESTTASKMFDKNTSTGAIINNDVPEWIIDLGKEYLVGALNYKLSSLYDAYGCYCVSGSEDGENWKRMTAFYIPSYCSGETGVLRFKTQKARFIKLSITNGYSSYNRIRCNELEIYAKVNAGVDVKSCAVEKNKVNLTAANNSDNEKSCSVIIAYKNENGVLIGTEEFRNTVIEANSHMTAVNMDIMPIPGTKEISVYVWNDAVTMLPYAYKYTTKMFYADSRNGDDNADGTYGSPLQSIESVRDRIRNINNDMSSDITVCLSGEFSVDSPIEFNENDSASNDYHIYYRGDNCIINGGRELDFEPVDNTPFYKAHVDNVSSIRQLYVNGNRAEKARSERMYWTDDEYRENGERAYVNADISSDGVIIAKDNFKNGLKYEDGTALVWLPSWKKSEAPVSGISDYDEDHYLIKLKQPYFDAMFSQQNTSPSISMPFYIEGCRSEFDRAGEWYFDEQNGDIYYYPLSGEAVINAYIPVSEGLINLSGVNDAVRNITFDNITFTYGAWSEPDAEGFDVMQAGILRDADVINTNTDGTQAYGSKRLPGQIRIKYGHNVSFINSRFEHLGSDAVSAENKSIGCRIEGNIFDDISGSAVSVGDSSLKTAISANCCRSIQICNNLIRRTGVEYFSSPAVCAYYVNNTMISNNDIKDVPYSGISVGWGWSAGTICMANNIICNNKIENVLMRLRDGAHIYTLSNQQRAVISGNCLIYSDEGKGGIYLDQGSGNMRIFDNVITKTENWFHMNSSDCKNNTIKDNFSDGNITVSEAVAQNNSVSEADKNIDSDKAVKIAENAGLDDEHRYLLDVYDSGLKNPFINKLSFNPYGIEMINASDYESFYDVDEKPTISYMYDGTGVKRIVDLGAGEWTEYRVNIPEDGAYRMIIMATSCSDSAYFNVYDNGGKITEVQAKRTGSSYWGVKPLFNEGNIIELTAGEHLIKIEPKRAVLHCFGFLKVQ